MAWNILNQRVLYKVALFTLKMLKLITIIYALILFVFNISSDVRCMKISREKNCWAKFGEGMFINPKSALEILQTGLIKEMIVLENPP